MSDQEDDDILEVKSVSAPKTSSSPENDLTQEQVDRIEKNRKRALEIKQRKEENSAKMLLI